MQLGRASKLNRKGIVAIIADALAARYAEGETSTRDAAEVAWGAAVDAIQRAVLAGFPVALPKIGTLVTVWRKEREAYNPAEGKRFVAPTRRVLKLRVSRSLRDVFKELGVK